MRTDCKIIGDLLPLHMDGVLSDESQKLVEEHLEECESCQFIAENMIISAVPLEENTKAILPFKKLKQKTKKVIIIWSIVAFFVGVMSLASMNLLGENGWWPIDRLFNIDPIAATNNDEHSNHLKNQIAAGENWSAQDIEFTEPSPNSGSYSPKEATFFRKFTYQNNPYCVAYKVMHPFVGIFQIQGYELCQYDENEKVWVYSTGSIGF